MSHTSLGELYCKANPVIEFSHELAMLSFLYFFTVKGKLISEKFCIQWELSIKCTVPCLSNCANSHFL